MRWHEIWPNGMPRVSDERYWMERNTCTVKINDSEMNDSDRDRNCRRESTIEEEGRGVGDMEGGLEEGNGWREEIDSTIQNGLHKKRIDRGSEWERG